MENPATVAVISPLYQRACKTVSEVRELGNAYTLPTSEYNQQAHKLPTHR